MSYEGYDIGLCCRGHRTSKDCYSVWRYDEIHKNTALCGECYHALIWVQSVDTTNGENESPWSFPRALDIEGFDDVPMIDHYGTKYFIKNLRYKIPAPGGEGRSVSVHCPECIKEKENVHT